MLREFRETQKRNLDRLDAARAESGVATVSLHDREDADWPDMNPEPYTPPVYSERGDLKELYRLDKLRVKKAADDLRARQEAEEKTREGGSARGGAASSQKEEPLLRVQFPLNDAYHGAGAWIKVVLGDKQGIVGCEVKCPPGPKLHTPENGYYIVKGFAHNNNFRKRKSLTLRLKKAGSAEDDPPKTVYFQYRTNVIDNS